MNFLSRTIDERFLAHRRQSTSIAGIISAVLAICLFEWRYFVEPSLELGPARDRAYVCRREAGVDDFLLRDGLMSPTCTSGRDEAFGFLQNKTGICADRRSKK
jgi:hypothetical protein